MCTNKTDVVKTQGRKKKTLTLFEATSGVTAEENQKGEESSLCEDCRSLRLHHTAVAKNNTQKKKSRLDRRHKTEERGQKKSKLRHTTHKKKKIKMTSEGQKKKKKTWTIKRCWREIQRRDGLNDCNVPETLVWPFFIYLVIYFPSSTPAICSISRSTTKQKKM